MATGASAYALKRLTIELKTEIQDNKKRIAVLEEQVKTLLAGKGGLKAEVAEAKLDQSKEEDKPLALEELKVKDLKALAKEYGIDDTDFGNKKAPYIAALKEKGIK